MDTKTAYKLARPDGWDFYTGNSVNYRSDHYPHTVIVPRPNAALGVCSSGVIHASKKPNDCFLGAKIPCSAYKVEGIPVCGDPQKWGFLELTVLSEITDLDTLFGWRYSEAVNPVNPFALPLRQPTAEDIDLLHQWAPVWASVRASVGASVWASVGDSVWASVWASVGASVWASVGASVGDSVWASVGDSVWASVWGYIGYIFPNVKPWRKYPFQPVVDLWRRGLVPSFDGKTWRLHSGSKAEIVYEEIGCLLATVGEK